MADMVTLAQITSIHWQPALGGDGVVEGEEDIHQCIRTILSTPKGSVPHRPNLGTNIPNYIDAPVNEATPHIIREAWDALTEQEPRMTLSTIVPIVDGSHVTLRVRWQLADGIERQTDMAVR